MLSQPPEQLRLYKLPKEGESETGPKTLLEDAQKLADAKVENEDRLALCYQLEGAISLFAIASTSSSSCKAAEPTNSSTAIQASNGLVLPQPYLLPLQVTAELSQQQA